MSVKAIVQSALDASLAGAKVYSHWQRKAKVKGESPDEYVVYTVDYDAPLLRADNQDLVKNANIAIRYYHSFALDETSSGREAVSEREKQIEAALKVAGMIVTAGPFDMGDIDDVGFNVTGYECSCARLIDGQVEKLLGGEG